MRCVIWDTKEVVAADVFEGMSDVFIRCFFDTKDAKETDTHFRCGDGKASFNYRLLFDYKAPNDSYNFSVQVWDRDFFCSNDLIGEVALDLQPLFTDVIDTNGTFSINKQYYNSFLKSVWGDKFQIKFEDEDSFWLPVTGKDFKTGEMRINGYLRMSLTVMPIDQ